LHFISGDDVTISASRVNWLVNVVPPRPTLVNLDRRIERIEQILPTLATRDELKAAIAPLATREEMREAIGLSALALREEIRASAEENRRHTTVLFESLRDDIRLLAERVVELANRPFR
jgi:hypothetical protein